ncbi:MAG: ABC transporter ATP-binding protein [Gemmiger sp.]
MFKIFKHLGRHWAACLAVVALLVVQAQCDLALPQYTSAIVDVGIQQGGVDSAVPETVRAGTLDALTKLMDEGAAQAAQAAYGPADADGVRTLQDGWDAALEDAFTLPDVALYLAAARIDGDGTDAVETADLDAAAAAVAAAPAEQLQAALAAVESAGAEDTVKSQAVLLVRQEYAAQGVDGQVQRRYLLRTGGQMLAFTLLMVAAAVGVGLLASRVGAAIGRDLRQSVFKKVVGFSNAETDRFSTASLITRTTNDIQQVQMTCVILLRMVAYAPIIGIGGIWRVAHTDTGLTWIIVVAVAALLGVVLALVSVAMPKFKQMQTLVDRLNLVSREILTGVMPIRAFSREKFEEERFDRASTDLMKTQLFTNRVMTFMMPVMMLIMNGVTLMIVWFGGKSIDAGGMQVGEMIAFITYTMQIVMAFLMLTMVSIMLPRAGVAADRIDEVLNTRPAVRDPETPAELPAGQAGVVCFNDVSFRYPGASEDALQHISFTAKPGQTTAIIGATGCGKSTLLNLIPRFYDVTGGSVTVGGVDVRRQTQAALRSQLGYVPQKGVLFSGTIESNLEFGGPDVTPERAARAASIAQAAEFIGAKPQGYQSPIAQGGSNVSGGQKQRLSIARAIARDPRIYLFDDSFSALDYKTDVALRRALKAETDNATVIIVAQRISTILHADQILVLEDGRIVGKGTHGELLQTCPEYREIARSQLSEKELDLDNTLSKGGEQ